MGRHLRLWRMDFPPAIAFIAEAVRATLGDSLLAIRLVPALAALGVLASPLFLRSANLFQPVVLDQLAWTVALYALIRLCRENRARWWLLLGAALGAGLLTKFSAAFIGLALLLAFLATDRRRWLRTPWPWLAALLALAIGSPGLVGQLRLDIPVLGQMADLRQSQLERVTPLDFVAGQLLWGPATLIGAAGLAGLLADRRLRAYRVAGWTCAWVFVILMALHGKAYYAGPVYPTLVGAGGVMLERVRAARLGPVLRWGSVVALLLTMAALLPIGVPILPPAAMARYARAIGATSALRTNTGEMEPLPQDYAGRSNRTPWPGRTGRSRHRIGRARSSSPPTTAKLAPWTSSDHATGCREPTGSYWFFGPGTKPGDVVVTIGAGRGDLAPLFDSVEAAGRVTSRWSVAEERDLTIYIARGPHRTLQELWPSLEGRN
jgi:hypothetical protein